MSNLVHKWRTELGVWYDRISLDLAAESGALLVCLCQCVQNPESRSTSLSIFIFCYLAFRKLLDFHHLKVGLVAFLWLILTLKHHCFLPVNIWAAIAPLRPRAQAWVLSSRPLTIMCLDCSFDFSARPKLNVRWYTREIAEYCYITFRVGNG